MARRVRAASVLGPGYSGDRNALAVTCIPSLALATTPTTTPSPASNGSTIQPSAVRPSDLGVSDVRAPFLTTQTLSRSRAAASGRTKALSRVGPVTVISAKVPGAGSVSGG
ncbi:MAG: hypothetical protein F4204_13570 [Rhodospirillaceae bacterium]|nr:hypothetical protein [Rhodospirillaceae bacterium]